MKIFAEQLPGTPESNSTSRLNTINNSLVALNHGSTSTGSWGDWGAMWNRIKSAGEWVPNGNAGESDVSLGKTFYSGNTRTVKTGTATMVDYASMSFQTKDYRDETTPGDGSHASWSLWSLTSGASPDTVYKDSRTGLYWSNRRGSANAYLNSFTISTCPFFSATSPGDYEWSSGDVCGDPIKMCADLLIDANNDGIPDSKWYLPTQAEAMQAYLDGIYLSTNKNWVTGDTFWSSVETQTSATYAWHYNLSTGTINNNVKGSLKYSVRCVLRDLTVQ